MENYLKYYYNIEGINFEKKNNDYLFSYGNYDFRLILYKGNLNYLNNIYELINNLLYRGIYCHQIVKTNNNLLYIIVDNKNYVLMKSYKNLNSKIGLKNIISFNYYINLNNEFNCSDWKKLWENKIDYFEYQLNQFGYKHPLLRESFGYYAGYVELAISLLNDIKLKNNLVLSHRRLNQTMTLYDLYNPFNLVIDYKIRDIAEFFKSKYLSKDIMIEIVNYLSSGLIYNEMYLLFFIRMLYPSFYFDKFEDIMNNDLNDDEIKNIVENASKYEHFIKSLYNNMLSFFNMPYIDWLANKKT